MKLLKESLTSIRHLLKNPAIYVPDLFMYIVTYSLTVFFYRSSGLDVALQNFIVDGATRVDMFKDFVFTNWFSLLLSLAVFVLVTFFLGVGVESIRFRLIKNALYKKESSLLRTIFSLNPYLFKLVILKIYVYMITALIFLISATMYIVYMQVDNNLTGMLIKALVIMVALPIVLFFRIGINYRYAILFIDEERHASKAIQKSFNLLVDRPRPVVKVWAFSVVMGMLLWAVVSGVGFYARSLQGMISNSSLVYAFSTSVMLLFYLANLTYGLWEHILLFRTYSLIKKSS